MSARSKYTFDSFSKKDDIRKERAKYTQNLPANQHDVCQQRSGCKNP